MEPITYPISTGALARALGVTEHTIQGAVRRGAVSPKIMSGRRVWFEEDVRKLQQEFDRLKFEQDRRDKLWFAGQIENRG
jgi:DNA-binding transcriptional MerR regulator